MVSNKGCRVGAFIPSDPTQFHPIQCICDRKQSWGDLPPRSQFQLQFCTGIVITIECILKYEVLLRAALQIKSMRWTLSFLYDLIAEQQTSLVACASRKIINLRQGHEIGIFGKNNTTTRPKLGWIATGSRPTCFARGRNEFHLLVQEEIHYHTR
jgi:hypothetical protein